jgi:GNAT superfamily N-acetyltransferase
MESVVMGILLIDITGTPDRFFSILPKDWSVEIAPFWDAYANTARIFGVQENDQIVAGGIVFSTVSPDTRGYEHEAQSWYDRGYLYIAFLFVSPEKRGKGLGSFWMNEVRKILPGQSFWLAVEDKDLVNFYQPLGFRVEKQVNNVGAVEWILADS